MSDIVRIPNYCRRSLVEVDGVKRVLFVASTSTPDRYGDVVDQASWKLDNYTANPVVLVDHDYEAECIVANGAVSLMGGALALEVTKWSRKQKALDVKADVEDEIIHAVSVGFRPGRYIARSMLPKDDPYYGDSGYAYYDCELLEVSFVAIPANPEALAAKKLEGLDVRALAQAIVRDPALLAELQAHLTLSGAPSPDADLLGFPEQDNTHTEPIGFFE